jgi:predicted transcriptional regulator
MVILCGEWTMSFSNGPVSFLAGSENRVETLVALRDGGAVDQREIADSVDASRRTVKRTLNDLEERGWVIAENGTSDCRISALGGIVLDTYLEVVNRLEPATHCAPFLQRVPTEAFDLDPSALADAEVVVAAENQPYAPMDRVLEVRRNASQIREVVNIVQADSAGQLRERVANGKLAAEIVLEAGVLDAIAANDDYAAEFEAAATADGATFYTYEGSIPYVFGLMDDTVILGVNDDKGMPEAVVVSDDPAVQEWAEDRFESYRSAADELTRS